MDAYIVAGYRSAVGKAKKGGFRFTRPDDLAADVIKYLVKSIDGLDPKRVDDLIVGNAVPDFLAVSLRLNQTYTSHLVEMLGSRGLREPETIYDIVHGRLVGRVEYLNDLQPVRMRQKLEYLGHSAQVLNRQFRTAFM